MKQYKIHIFCLKREICKLILKKLKADGYFVECTNLAEAEPDFLDNFNKSFDCIILDKDTDEHLREKIRLKFPDLPIICLPSLDSDKIDISGITYISEPLRLSELSDIISKFRSGKELETKQ